MTDETVECPQCGCRLAESSMEGREGPHWAAYLTGHDDGYQDGYANGSADGWESGWADAGGGDR
jgi:hypothetical protein